MVGPRWVAENVSLKEKVTDKMKEVSELRALNFKLKEAIEEARLKTEQLSNSKLRLTVILRETVLGLNNSFEQMSVSVEFNCLPLLYFYKGSSAIFISE